MRNRHPFKKGLAACVASLLLASAGMQVHADDAIEAKSLELRRIMQELGKSMQAVTDGISHEDWAAIVKLAPKIAEHPQPPAGERVRILAFIGADAGKFKGYDQKTQQAAQGLEQAALRNDGKSVIAAFANLQNSCLACHQDFRKSFVEHFYGKR